MVSPITTFVIVDIRRINSQAVYAQKTGMIILGGGVSKHHTCNANLMVSNEVNFKIILALQGICFREKDIPFFFYKINLLFLYK